MVLSDSAAERAAKAVAERDAIQANLLELDGSYVRQVLAGATLTGQTRQSWEAASAALTGLWESYMAYSAVVDRVAELGVGERRPSKKDIPELTELLTGACVRLSGAPVPLARRDLADTGRPGGHARDGDRHDAQVVHRGPGERVEAQAATGGHIRPAHQPRGGEQAALSRVGGEHRVTVPVRWRRPARRPGRCRCPAR